MFRVLRLNQLRLVLPCALVPLLFGQVVRAEPDALERLLSAKPTRTGLTVTVSTGGCTEKSDFQITSHRNRSGAASVEVRRLTPDACKGNFPDGMTLSFSWKELKLPKKTTISIKNPVEHPSKLARNVRYGSMRHKWMRGCHHVAARFSRSSASKTFLRIAN
jgi:hypothetical protein